MDINATPLRGFLKVAELGSFTRAAEALHTSQPALSASIRELERRLGFSLFDRTSRRVSLTREGRAFLVNAKRVVIETDWLHLAAREIRTNELKIATQYNSVLVPARVAITDGFLDRQPGTAMQVVSLSHADLYEALRADDVDIALVLEPGSRTELSPINTHFATEFEAYVLQRRPLGFLVPGAHPLAARESLGRDDLTDTAVVTVNRTLGGAMSSAIMRELEAKGARVIRAPEGDVISVMRFALRYNALAIDLGWVPPPPELAASLRSLGMNGPTQETELIMLRRRSAPRPAAELFWEYAREFRGLSKENRGG